MTTIIGFAGKKQSGKNTSCNFIVGHCLTSLGIVRGTYQITEKGQLWISDLFGDTNYEGVFDISRNNEAMRNFLKDHLDSYVKLYSFADVLKQDVCMKVLGLSYEQCYGTDEDKNSETHLRWEDMPGVVTPQQASQILTDISGHGENPEDIKTWFPQLIIHEPGLMTAREVMQFVGTEIFRKMYSHVWVDATIRKIQSEAPAIALISDVRFPNEVTGLQRAGGYVVRFTRNGDSPDKHPSETSLDPDVFDWNTFNLVIDNAKMSIKDQGEATYSLLHSLGLIEEASNVK